MRSYDTRLGKKIRKCGGGTTMAGGGNFLHRVISYVVNELVVNGLANSPSFQRFAVKTSKRIEDISSKATQTKQQLAEQLKDISKKYGGCVKSL
ncbi:Phycobilisome rod-core linker polypeptide CpcG2 like [Senna tora]|uniref:Phycobilisome rod-core linker polypeptide CpcG2 like n=1 Tax=Senna tora TaxID=362788 RepID=A0A835CM97_9FABA|nr:Phycobilisome rod-core linker polypeptide CpcG2 like [Senna tora]